MENSLINSSDYFTDIKNARKARKYWKRLVKKFQSKSGSSVEIIQKINYQYFSWQDRNNPKYAEEQLNRDISKYIKTLNKLFSYSEWSFFFNHPMISIVFNNINKKKKV